MTTTRMGTPSSPPPAGLPYDPEAILLGVLPWLRTLACRWCHRRGLAHLAEDIEGELVEAVWRGLVSGRYDPGRAKPTTYAAWVFRSLIRRALPDYVGAIRVPYRSPANVAIECPATRAARSRALSGTVVRLDEAGPTGESMAETLADRRPGPGAVAEAEERRRERRGRLDCLLAGLAPSLADAARREAGGEPIGHPPGWKARRERMLRDEAARRLAGAER